MGRQEVRRAALAATQAAGFVITSGVRTPQQNAAVGGAPNSGHLFGLAYDAGPKGGWAPAGSRERQAQMARILDEASRQGLKVLFHQVPGGAFHAHLSQTGR